MQIASVWLLLAVCLVAICGALSERGDQICADGKCEEKKWEKMGKVDDIDEDDDDDDDDGDVDVTEDVDCSKRCHNKFEWKMDKYGYDKCVCTTCPVMTDDLCKEQCKSGSYYMEKDDSGCKQCKCRTCPPLTCDPCNEYVVEKGCPTCKCKCKPRLITIKGCKEYKLNKEGCETRHCKKYKKCVALKKLGCETTCKTHERNKKDANGCVTCQCEPKPRKKLPELPDIPENEKREDLDDNLWEEEEDVCKKYDCKEDVCKNVFRAQDKNGCLTCKCCPKDGLKTCPDLICSNGFQHDRHTGCPICKCIKNETCSCSCKNKKA